MPSLPHQPLQHCRWPGFQDFCIYLAGHSRLQRCSLACQPARHSYRVGHNLCGGRQRGRRGPAKLDGVLWYKLLHCTLVRERCGPYYLRPNLSPLCPHGSQQSKAVALAKTLKRVAGGGQSRNLPLVSTTPMHTVNRIQLHCCVLLTCRHVDAHSHTIIAAPHPHKPQTLLTCRHAAHPDCRTRSN